MGAGGALAGRITRRVRRALWPPPPPPAAVPPQERWTYDRDGLKTLHNNDFLKDPLFREAYRLGRETGSWHGYDMLPEVKAEKVCYLSLDMNCAGPEMAAAEFFWGKMSGGAVMVLDDYGFSNFIRQKRAFDAFARAKGVEVLSLPTGQGLIFKP